MAKAAALGIPFVLSTASIVSMERVAQAGGDLWFQLYMLPDLGRPIGSWTAPATRVTGPSW